MVVSVLCADQLTIHIAILRRMAIHQHGVGGKVVVGTSSAASSLPVSSAQDADALVSILSQPSPSSQCAQMVCRDAPRDGTASTNAAIVGDDQSEHDAPFA
jgi:hypothetical protein